MFLLMTIFVVIMHLNGFGPLESAQRSVDDFLIRFVAPKGTRPNVVIVNVDVRSQNELSDWPWNRDLIADLIAATAHGEPKSILLDFKLPEDANQDSSGDTDTLSRQLAWIDQAVLSYDIAPSTFKSGKTRNPKYLFNNSLLVDNLLGEMNENSSLLVRKVFLPAEKLIEHKPYLGFDYDAPDDDYILRHQPLVMNFEGYYYPSQTLLAATVYLGETPENVKVIEGQEIQIGGKRTVPTNSKSELFISFIKPPEFVKYSAADILSEGFDHNVLNGKMVLIGVEDEATTESFKTTMSSSTPSWLIKATVLDNIINDNLVVTNESGTAINLLILFVLGGAFSFLLPRVSVVNRTLVIGGGLIILVNANYFILTTFQILPQTIYVALELILFAVVSPLLDSEILGGSTDARFIAKESRMKAKAKKKASEEAEVSIRELPFSNRDQENVATKAVDGEHMKETSTLQAASTKALGTDETDSEDDLPFDHQAIDAENAEESFADSIQSGAMDQDHHALSLDQTPRTSSSSEDEEIEEDSSSSSSKLQFGHPDIKSLGRYQIEGILGKGSMGLVYKGIDPAINRPVALKTIRLDFVNDPAELEELKERLFREAQAVGKLSHPNIVTIYDVGSEGHLQYIAMEFLEGQTLEEMIKTKVKFNYRIIAQIINQICLALDYAHERNIVHRDIKPANIMILGDYSVKVMDYGIARVDSNSMTKTGIAMGTPNYISPEQLKGIPIDRRSDLFSLGVVMYEMLLGRRPFRGENITQLIYAITNHEPEKPSVVNPEVPLLFDHIISKALKKNARDRYQKASEIAEDLMDFVSSFAR